jgi:hypothetical protein
VNTYGKGIFASPIEQSSSVLSATHYNK